MQELLSIIIASYKNGPLILETLQSIFDQDYPSIEIIICDDATPDFDKPLIDNYIEENKNENIKSIEYLINENNIGTVRNLNRGIEAANGKYIKIIAGDDEFAASTVCSEQIAYLKANTDKLIVYGSILECDSSMNALSVSGFKEDGKKIDSWSRDELLKYIARENDKAMATQAACFRFEFFREHGKFDESFLLIEDLPTAIRIVSNRVPFGHIDKPCVKHRGSTGVSTSNTLFDTNRIKYYEDLKRYYEISLGPVKKSIGPGYVSMRKKVCDFRIKMCEQSDAGRLKKACLTAQYSLPLAYYAITNSKRTLFYMKRK